MDRTVTPAGASIIIRDILLEILVNLPPAYCIRYQILCKLWREILQSQTLWMRKCKQYWPEFPLHDVKNYYKLFLQRGGGYFVTSAQHFLKLKQAAQKNGCLNQIDALTPKGSFQPARAWRIQEDNGLHIIYSAYDHLFDDEFKTPTSWRSEIFHPNVSIPLNLFDDDSVLYTIMDPLMENMLDKLLLDKRTGELTEEKIIKITHQILLAVKYMHEQQQLIAKNYTLMLICDIKDNWFKVKLFVYEYADVILDSLWGNIVPPDIILDDYSPASDMWAIGDLIHRMLFGGPLYGHLHPIARSVHLKTNGVVFNDPNNEVSDAAKDFLKKLLAYDPQQRMTIDEAMKHEWMRNPKPAATVLKMSLAK